MNSSTLEDLAYRFKYYMASLQELKAMAHVMGNKEKEHDLGVCINELVDIQARVHVLVGVIK